MKILVDADACPVISIVEKIAKEKNIEVILVCDTSHVFDTGYSKVIIVDKEADSADFRLIQETLPNDIVVTQDYGVASMALGKKAYPIHQNGKWYTNENIDIMMMERHINKTERRKNSRSHLKGPKKRTEEDDVKFETSFKKLIDTVLQIDILKS